MFLFRVLGSHYILSIQRCLGLTFFGLGVIFLGMPSFLGLLFEIVCKLVIILGGGVLISIVIVCLCTIGVESKDHLFSECSFNKTIKRIRCCEEGTLTGFCFRIPSLAWIFLLNKDNRLRHKV